MESLYKTEMENKGIEAVKRDIEWGGYSFALKLFNMRLKCSGMDKDFTEAQFDYLTKYAYFSNVTMKDVDFLEERTDVHSGLEFGYLDAKGIVEQGAGISEVRDILLRNGVKDHYYFGWYLYYVTHRG